MKKLEYLDIKKLIENKNFELISKTYNGYYSELILKCNCGYIFKTNWNSFKSSVNGCPKCSIKQSAKNRLKNFEYIKDFFEKNNFRLLSIEEEYLRNYTKLDVICPNNHKLKINWSEFKRGVRCPICSGVKKKTIDEIKNYMLEFDYILLSKKYQNGKQKLLVECNKGHKYKTTWYNFEQGARCPDCKKINLSIMQSGPNCKFWKGGISREPYCYIWTKELKELIKERDGYSCLNPECNKKESILAVHHIDYNKKNCCKENLITVCKSCNSRANSNREWYKYWYKAILFRRYKYIEE